MNVRKNFLLRVSKKTLYITTIALLAFSALGVFLLSDSSSTVSAQRGESRAKVASSEVLAMALELGSATEYSVFADKGIVENNSRINGKVGVAQNDEAAARARKDVDKSISIVEVLPCAEKSSELRTGKFEPGVYCASSGKLSGEYVLDGNGKEGSIFIFRVDGSLNAKDVNISLINGAQAHNVFFVAGESATVAENVDLPGSIFARGSITVGTGATVRGKVLSSTGKVALSESVVGPGTGVLEICKNIGPTFALGSGLGDRIFRFQIGGPTGPIVRVLYGTCAAPITLPAGPVTITELLDTDINGGGTSSGRFRLIRVTSPIDGAINDDNVNLATRTVTVNVRPSTVVNETPVNFVNVFAVTAVIEICKFPARDVAADGVTRPAPSGTTAAAQAAIRDRDVAGVFDYTIDVLGDQVFSVALAAGQAFNCSRPIQVNVPTDPAAPPAPASIRITEIGEEGFTLEEVAVTPFSRPVDDDGLASTPPVNDPTLNFVTFNRGLEDEDGDGFQDDLYFNPGGGIAGVDVLEGGTPNSTIVSFFNRSNPAPIKICKVNGGGIPEGTRFLFEIRGRESSVTQSPPGTPSVTFQAPAPNPINQTPIPSTDPNFRILPGVDTVRRLEVPTGFCRFVTENQDGTGRILTYIVGSNALIAEAGVVTGGVASTTDPRAVPIDPIPGIPAGQPGGPACTPPGTATNPCPAIQTDPATGVRVSRIRFNQTGDPATPAQSAGFESPSSVISTAPTVSPGYTTTGTTTLSPNPDLTGRRAIIRVRREFNVIEFTNFLFRPVILKICKIAGPGVDQGTPFTFTTTIANPNNLFTSPGIFPTSISTTVTAGPAGTASGGDPNDPNAGGNCVVVAGPFTPTGGSTPTPFGTFNFGQTITITEGATTPASTVDRIRVLGGTQVSQNLAGRTVTLRLDAVNVAAGGIPVNEVEFTNSRTVTPPGPRAAAFDFDGDGKSDMSAYRPSNGVWHLLRSRDGYTGAQFGTAEDKVAAADYDGDGKADIAVFRPSNGVWYILRSRDGFTGVQFGQTGDMPVAADFDGDGKADIAVFRPSNGVWYILRSRDGFTGVQFGTNGDQPAAADFDGDGKADIAVYRRGDGVWHMLRSRDGYTGVQFGANGDQPVAADYDGDGKADIAVYRRSSGVWHILGSRNGYSGVQFGIESDTPVPADFNGDGKTDIAVFRSGTWHVLDSGQGESSGYRAVQFGTEGDTPVPSAFR
jgi:hypothetical protein